MGYKPTQLRDPRTGRWMRRGASVAKAVNLEVFPQKPAPPLRRGRGYGWKGAKQNFRPKIRVNKRGQTVLLNTGTFVAPHHRIAVGTYARLEDTRKVTPVDRFTAKGVKKAFPKGTRRGRAYKVFRESVRFSNPAVRAQRWGVQARLGTSRYGGPTLIVQKGAHKTPWDKSRAGVQKYDRRMKAIAGEKAKFARTRSRQQRRKQARKMKKRK